jgi:hypothetical protein
MLRLICRSFHTESVEERQEWMDAYVKVQNELSTSASTTKAAEKAADGACAMMKPGVSLS